MTALGNGPLIRIDEAALARLAPATRRVADGVRAIGRSDGVQLVVAALTDSGLLGPAVVAILIGACLLAAAGGELR